MSKNKYRPVRIIKRKGVEFIKINGQLIKLSTIPKQYLYKLMTAKKYRTKKPTPVKSKNDIEKFFKMKVGKVRNRVGRQSRPFSRKAQDEIDELKRSINLSLIEKSKLEKELSIFVNLKKLQDEKIAAKLAKIEAEDAKLNSKLSIESDKNKIKAIKSELIKKEAVKNQMLLDMTTIENETENELRINKEKLEEQEEYIRKATLIYNKLVLDSKRAKEELLRTQHENEQANIEIDVKNKEITKQKHKLDKMNKKNENSKIKHDYEIAKRNYNEEFISKIPKTKRELLTVLANVQEQKNTANKVAEEDRKTGMSFSSLSSAIPNEGLEPNEYYDKVKKYLIKDKKFTKQEANDLMENAINFKLEKIKPPEIYVISESENENENEEEKEMKEGSGMDVRGTTSDQLDSIMEGYSNYYGAISLDELDDVLSSIEADFDDFHVTSFIVLLKNKLYPKGHWVCFFIDKQAMYVGYYNSFGFDCPEEIKTKISVLLDNVELEYAMKWKYNKMKIQPDESDLCGLYCCHTLTLLYFGHSWKEATNFKGSELDNDLMRAKNNFGFV